MTLIISIVSLVCRTTIYIVITKSGRSVGVLLAVHKDLVSKPMTDLEQDSFRKFYSARLNKGRGTVCCLELFIVHPVLF